MRLSNKFGKFATIKCSCTPEGLWVCKQLSRQLIRVNVTLIFSVTQAILSAKAGATYVSPFVGRVDDNSFGGLCLRLRILLIYSRKTEIYTLRYLQASIRNVRDVGRAFEYGATYAHYHLLYSIKCTIIF